MTAITGKTYPVRGELRAMGGVWNANQRAWLVPDEKAAAARALVAVPARRSAPRPAARRSYGGVYREFEDAPQPSSNYGRCGCEDYPCCGH